MGVAADNGDMSATAVLNHELDHTVQHDKNPEQFKKDSNTPDKQYSDKEEARVIKGSEQNTAQALKEMPAGIPTRTNHKAQPYPTTGVTSTKSLVQQQLEDKKIKRKHNDFITVILYANCITFFICIVFAIPMPKSDGGQSS